MKKLILLLPFLLSACEHVPPEVTVASCSVAPALVPEFATEIIAACSNW